jgi:hypothetical protein
MISRYLENGHETSHLGYGVTVHMHICTVQLRGFLLTAQSNYLHFYFALVILHPGILVTISSLSGPSKGKMSDDFYGTLLLSIG